jgi:hypothetical protein
MGRVDMSIRQKPAWPETVSPERMTNYPLFMVNPVDRIGYFRSDTKEG